MDLFVRMRWILRRVPDDRRLRRHTTTVYLSKWIGCARVRFRSLCEKSIQAPLTTDQRTTCPPNNAPKQKNRMNMHNNQTELITSHPNSQQDGTPLGMPHPKTKQDPSKRRKKERKKKLTKHKTQQRTPTPKHQTGSNKPPKTDTNLPHVKRHNPLPPSQVLPRGAQKHVLRGSPHKARAGQSNTDIVSLGKIRTEADAGLRGRRVRSWFVFVFWDCQRRIEYMYMYVHIEEAD